MTKFQKDMKIVSNCSRKGMDVVYIYHDTIDAAGHQNKSIFGACEETIDELKNMVRVIMDRICLPVTFQVKFCWEKACIVVLE